VAEADDLSYNLEALGLPPEARAWLMDVWHVIHVLDDAMDGDKADPADVRKAVWAVFLTMPGNPFFQANIGSLLAVLVLQVRKWEAANAVEAEGERTELAYAWRGGFYDLVEFVCHLCGLPDTGRLVMRLYGETFADYKGAS
jgi:hypothetical protein